MKRIGVDTAMHVVTVHGVDGKDRPVLRRARVSSQCQALGHDVMPLLD